MLGEGKWNHETELQLTTGRLGNMKKQEPENEMEMEGGSGKTHMGRMITSKNENKVEVQLMLGAGG